MRAERRPMLPTAVRHASHAHAAQHDARHEAAHMVGGWCPPIRRSGRVGAGRGSNSEPPRRIWGGRNLGNACGGGGGRRSRRERIAILLIFRARRAVGLAGLGPRIRETEPATLFYGLLSCGLWLAPFTPRLFDTVDI
jgi:hypothetical protein